VNSDERIPFDTCGISPSTPVESPLSTDSQNPSSTPVESSQSTDTTSNLGITVSSVVGAVLGNLAVLVMVIADCDTQEAQENKTETEVSYS